LHLHTQPTEPLLAHLADHLRAPGDPFAIQTIVTPSRAVARWLSMALAKRLGVIAQIHWAQLTHWLEAPTGGAILWVPSAQPALDARLPELEPLGLHLYRPEARPEAAPTPELLACGGPLRQVEAVRDALLRAFERWPDLHPHQIALYAPDPEAIAPFVGAVFGDPPPGTPALRWSLAERSQRANNPAADTLGALLRLATARITASEVLDLATRPIVRRRFGFADDDLPQLHTWIADAGIRWGIDGAHRAERGQPDEPRNTWRFGLDRLLLGCAMPDERGAPWRGVVPFDAVEGRITHLLGRFADLCEHLFGHLNTWQAPADAATWRPRLSAALEDLCAHGADDHDAHRATRRLLEALPEAPEYTVQQVRAWLEDQLTAPTMGRRFLAGGITLAPLRADALLPFRVVAVLGVGVTQDPAPLSGAHHAAGDAFIVAYEGIDPYDGTPRSAPSAVRRLAAQAGVTPRRVPLRPWTDPAGFDPRERATAEALQAAPLPDRPFVSERLPAPDVTELALTRLAGFYKDPLAAFTRRLGLYVPEASVALPDREPLVVDPLTQWSLGDQLFTRRLSLQPEADARAALVAGGRVPFGAAGQVLLSTLGQLAHAVAQKVEAFRHGDPLPPIDVDLPISGLRLTGRIDGLWGPGLLLHQSGKIRAHHLMKAWVLHLAMLHRSGFPGQTLLVGRADSRQGEPAAFGFGPVADPGTHLKHLVDGWRLGMQAPLPLLAGPTYAYVDGVRRTGSLRGRAVANVERRWGWAMDRDPNAERLVGRTCRLTHPDALKPGLLAPIDTPLPAFAQRIWGPLIDAVRRRSDR
jgi:exodeoxyribonuclease V gamma subunit